MYSLALYGDGGGVLQESLHGGHVEGWRDGLTQLRLGLLPPLLEDQGRQGLVRLITERGTQVGEGPREGLCFLFCGRLLTSPCCLLVVNYNFHL